MDVAISMSSQTNPAMSTNAPVVVAIPVRDEAERLPDCLRALDDQGRKPDMVVLLLNNCVDNSEHIGRQMRAYVGYELAIETRTLPVAIATAGEARRLAVSIAAGHAGPCGLILTTDADATVPRDWVQRNVTALKATDLVCGRVTLNPAESARIPAHLHADDALECELLQLLDEIAWTVDPQVVDPWPRHTEEAGASLGMTASILMQVGGMPARPSGEDRALAHALRLIDARIRHDPGIVVTVSGRLEGRAAGGMADTIKRRMFCQDTYTDDKAEPAHIAWQRGTLRATARAAWAGKRNPGTLAKDLGIRSDTLAYALDSRFFGQAWAAIEENSPVLQRERVRFADLHREIAAARGILAQYDLPGRTAD